LTTLTDEGFLVRHPVHRANPVIAVARHELAAMRTYIATMMSTLRHRGGGSRGDDR
jgi:hypothetical protein